MTEPHHGFKARAVSELKATFVVFAYLAVFLGAFMTYRRLLLAEYQIVYLHYGYAIFEALILAKVVMLGNVLRLGERYHHRPLIVPTVYKTICFSGLVLVFSVLEHLVTGLYHGETVANILNEIIDVGLWELLTRALVIVFAFIPLFAVMETSRALGPGTLFEMFFRRQVTHELAAAAATDPRKSD